MWPATGIALAALLVLGYRAWPAIFLGAFLVNVTNTGHVPTSIAIGLGNTAEALAGAFLVDRFARGRHAFERARDIFKFTLLAALASTMVSATVGVTSLGLGRIRGRVGFRRDLDDVVAGRRGRRPRRGPGPAAVELLVADARGRSGRSRKAIAPRCSPSSLVAGFVFGGLSPSDTKNYPLEFLCLPLLVWAAFRFGQREAATASRPDRGDRDLGHAPGLGPFSARVRRTSRSCSCRPFWASSR